MAFTVKRPADLPIEFNPVKKASYDLISGHMVIMGPSLNHYIHVYANVSFSDEAHIEFCCHLARGNIDPKETPVYEYVKFVGDFKFHKNGKEFSGPDPQI